MAQDYRVSRKCKGSSGCESAVESNPVVEQVRKESVMTIQCSLPSDGTRDFGRPPRLKDFIEEPDLNGSAYQGSVGFPSSSPATKSAVIALNLENLKCFEVVERQFQECGIIFRNALALQPSNPAFEPRSGTTVLLGAPKNGFLEIIFHKPACFFSGYITSSQRTILTAYDSQDNPIARTEMSRPNLAGSDSEIPPNHQLSLNVPNICRITFYAFDGQLTLDDLSFGL